MASKGKAELLARVNFPPYSVRMLTPRHLVIAGGGGNTKTGIMNAIEIYELSFNGTKCCALPATRYEIGESACMNLATWYNGKCHVLAAGLDGDCQLYEVKYKVIHPEEEGEVLRAKEMRKTESRRLSLVRKRRQSESERDEAKNESNSARKGSTTKADSNSNSVLSTVGFEFRPLQRFQTDFPANDDEPYQKVTCVARDFSFLVTGGTDGHVRVWQYPDFNLVQDIKAHADDVDDIDIHPTCTKIVSVSRDGHAFIWNVSDGKKCSELKWLPANGQKYRYRNCRFGVTEGDKVNSKLFTSYVPVVKQKNAPPCYVIKWDATQYVPQKVQSVGRDLSAMAVSDDGQFVGIGTMSGTVSIYIAFSLQRLYHVPETHSIFVTGLEFLPSTEESSFVVGEQDASLISISVDNQIQIHHIPKQATISATWFMIAMFILLFVIFFLLTYLDF